MHISILLMEQIIQLFLMIFMGFLIVKAKLLNSEDSKILSIIVLYLIIPCVIINAFQVDYTPQTVKGLLIALAGSVMTQVILLIVVSILGRVFHLNEVEAARAVRDSYLSKALAMDKDFVDHDTVEEWAEFIYDEINHESLLMM